MTTRNASIEVLCTAEQKREWIRLAKMSRMSFSSWVRIILDQRGLDPVDAETVKAEWDKTRWNRQKQPKRKRQKGPRVGRRKKWVIVNVGLHADESAALVDMSKACRAKRTSFIRAAIRLARKYPLFLQRIEQELRECGVPLEPKEPELELHKR